MQFVIETTGIADWLAILVSAINLLKSMMLMMTTMMVAMIC